jgi:hypothetical protein
VIGLYELLDPTTYDIADIVKSGAKTPKIKNQINKMLPP